MANVYEIATKITMANGVSAVLATVAKQVMGLDGNVKSLQKNLSTLKGALSIGGGMAIAGGTALALGLKGIAENARDLSHELVQLQKLNITAPQLAQVQGAAVGVTQAVGGVSEIDALKAYGSAYSMFGHEDAVKLMKPLTEFAQVMGNTTGDYKGAEDKLYSMIRSGDLMGKFIDDVTHKIDPEKLKSFLDLGARAILGTHGYVSADTWLGMAQQGGPALSGMSDKGLMTMAIVAQAMGGQRAGTALTSLYQQVVGGRGAQQAATTLHNLGLMPEFQVGRGGHLTWDQGALAANPFAKTLKEDPLEAIHMMRDAMIKHGYDTIDKQVPLLFEAFGRQTTQREVHDLLRNFDQIYNERQRLMGAMGVEDSLKVQGGQDYTQAEQNLSAAWKNLMLAIAGPNSENAIRIMNALTDALNSLSTKIRGSGPAALANISGHFAGVSAVLVGGGVIAMLASICSGLGALSATLIRGGGAIIAALGPAGWLVIGIAGLIALLKSHEQAWGIDKINKAMDDFAQKVDAKIAGAFRSASETVQVFARDMGDWFKAMGDAGVAAIQRIVEAIKGIASAIGGAISGALGSITHSDGGGNGGGRGRSGLHYEGYRPAPPVRSGGGAQNINVFLDGEQLHRSVIRAEYRATEHPRQAPAFDGSQHFGTPDGMIWEA